MGLRDRLRRIRGRAGELGGGVVEGVSESAGGIADQVRKAHAYLDGAAPVVTDALAASQRLSPSRGFGIDVRDPGGSFQRVQRDLRDLGAITREPAFYGLNRALGIDAPSNPLAGGQEAAARRAAKGVEGPLGPLARAGVNAAALATDYTNLAGGTSGGIGRIAAREMSLAGGFGAAQSLASEGLGNVSKRLGLGREGGELAGSLVGGPAMLGAGRSVLSRVQAARAAARGEAQAMPNGVFGAQAPMAGRSTGGTAARAGSPLRAVRDGAASLVAPSLTRDAAFNRLLDSYVKRVDSGAEAAAYKARRLAQAPEAVLADEITAGRVALNAQGRARLAARIAAASTPGDVAAVRAWVGSQPIDVMQYPDHYTFTRSRRSKDAVDRIETLTNGQLTRERAANAAPETTRDHYVKQLYEREPERVAVPRGPTSGQGHFRHATFEGYDEALAHGYRPLTTNLADLMAVRVKAGETAIAHRSFLDQMKATAAWVRPAIVWDKARKTWVKNPDIPADWKPDDGIFSHTFGTMDTAMVRGALEDLEAGALAARGTSDPAAIAEAMRRVRASLGAGESHYYLNPHVADALHAQFDPRSQKGWVRAVDAVTSEARGMRLGFDVAMWGRQLPQAYVQAVAADPAHGWRGLSNVTLGLARTLVPGAWDRFLLSDRYQRWAPYLTVGPDDLGEALARPTGGTFLQRHLTTQDGNLLQRNLTSLDPNAWKARAAGAAVGAGVGALQGDTPEERLRYALLGGAVGAGTGPAAFNSLYGLERWQFGKLIPSLKVELADTAFQNYRGMKGYQHLSDDALREMIGRRMETLTTGISRVRAGTSQNEEWAQRQFILSPTLARGAVANVGDAFKPGVEGDLARRFWVGMATTAIATSVGLSLLFTGDASPEHLRNLLDPTRKSAITNPNGDNFLGVELAGGHTVNFWGPLTAPLRMVVSPLQAAAMGAAEGENFVQSVVNATVAALTGEKDAAQRFAQGRRSVPVGMIQDWYRNKDFRGRAIATSNDPEERRRQMLMFQARQLTPSITGLAISTDRVNQPAWEGSRGAERVGAALQASGLNFTPAPNDPQPIKDTVSVFLASQGIDAGRDPVGTYRKAAVDGRISTLANQEFVKNHANRGVVEYIRSKRSQRAVDADRPMGRDAVSFYQAKADEITAWLEEGVRKNDEVNANNGERWRQVQADLYQRAAIRREQARADWLGSTDATEAQAIINRTFGGDARKKDHLAELVNAYYSMKPADASRAALDTFYDQRREWLTALKRDDPQGYAEFKRYQELGQTPMQREYGRALELMDAYQQIPPYRGLSVEEGRRVAAILDRARDRVRNGLAKTQKTAILLDEDTEFVFMARRAASGKISSRERSHFWRQNAPLLGKYFSSLLGSEIDQLTA